MRLILATHNNGKKNEIAKLLRGYDVVSLSDLGFDDEIVEDGATFEENANIKVSALKGLYPGDYILGDDSGLEIDPLGGLPGVITKRWAGEGASESEIRKFCLDKMAVFEDMKDRIATFVCSLSLYDPRSGKIVNFRGELKGFIALSEGKNMEIPGLAYGPIFLLEDRSTYLSEIHLKNLPIASHRAKAITRLVEYLELE